jgi:hypothetical protein
MEMVAGMHPCRVVSPAVDQRAAMTSPAKTFRTIFSARMPVILDG